MADEEMTGDGVSAGHGGAFRTYRIPPPAAGAAPPFVAFDQLSGIDPVTGRELMFLAIAPWGTGCAPPDAPDPPIALRVGTAAAVTLVPGTPVSVAGPSGTAGRATLSGSGVLLVEVEVLATGGGWQIQLGGPTGAVMAVADTPGARAQPWVDVPEELAFATETGAAVTRSLRIANRGTGPLGIANPIGPLGSGFSLADVSPRTLAPNTCAEALIRFDAPAEPGQTTGTLRVDGDDSADSAPEHNARVALTAVVRRPLWASDDVLVGDVADGSASGVIYRVSPTLGQSVLSAAGRLVSPLGMAFDIDGNLLVADGGPGDAPGWLLRIDRFTGAQTVLSSGGGFVSPAGVAVGRDGAVYVADAGPFSESGSVLKVDPVTGEQTVVTSGGQLGTPCDLVLLGEAIIVVRGDAFGGAGAVIRVGLDGSQSVVASGQIFKDPSLRPQALALEPSGTLLVAETHSLAGGLIRVNADTGAQQRLPAALRARPVGVATSADGRILISSERGPGQPPVNGVLEVDPVSGQATAVSVDGLFGRPRRLVIAP